MADPLRCLILTADYGGGHRSAATALGLALRSAYGPGVAVNLCNPLHEPGAPPLLRGLEQGYSSLLRRAPQLYDGLYRAGNSPALVAALAQALVAACRPLMRRLLAQHAPDLIIGTFPLLAWGAAAALPASRTLPLLTITTDLGPLHRLWFTGQRGLWTVATLAAGRSGLDAGLAPQQIRQTGIPIHPAFCQPANPALLRAVLGWERERPVVLLAGGGAGIGPIAAWVEVLEQAGLAVQLAVATGQNRALASELRARRWRIPVHVYGPLPHLANHMRAADVVITRAGGLTLSETLAAGRPALIYGASPGQERGNQAYLCDGGAAVAVDSPAQGVAQLRHWLADRYAYASAVAATRRLGLPCAAFEVARLVWELAGGAAAEGRSQGPGSVPRGSDSLLVHPLPAGG